MALELDLTAAGGFIYYYGITPWINCLEDKEICKIIGLKYQISKSIEIRKLSMCFYAEHQIQGTF